MRSWRAHAAVAVAVAAVLLSLLAAGEGQRPRKCISDSKCGKGLVCLNGVCECTETSCVAFGKVCLGTGVCGLPKSRSACTISRKCSVEARPSNVKQCDSADECVTGQICARNTRLGYNTCMCPGDTKWLDYGLLTGICNMGPIFGMPPPPGGPIPAGCGCEDGKLYKTGSSSECVAEADCPPEEEEVKPVKPATLCGANEQWYDVIPCPNKCLAADRGIICDKAAQSGCGCASGLASLVDGTIVCKARNECDANAV
jgi:hypothetical protein